MLVYLDGEFLLSADAKISVSDRGFIFGDGVYEVTRAIDGRLFAEEEHWLRLERGLRELEIAASSVIDRDRVREVSLRLLEENGLTSGDATVYLQVTRGAAARTHWFPPAETRPTVYLSAQRFEVPRDLRADGATAVMLPDIRWARCDIKTVNLLGSVLAKQRAREAGAFDAVLVRDGAVTEGGSSNAFAVIDGTLRTHPRSQYILPGITRDIVLEIARDAGYVVDERPILIHELPRASEFFFTGTTTDVQPIVAIDAMRVGDGAPGPVARALSDGLEDRMRGG